MKSFLTGIGIRLSAAAGCLMGRHYIFLKWRKEKDGDLSFRLLHKGCNSVEVIHRLKVDAVEMLEEIRDQEDALFEAKDILR